MYRRITIQYHILQLDELQVFRQNNNFRIANPHQIRRDGCGRRRLHTAIPYNFEPVMNRERQDAAHPNIELGVEEQLVRQRDVNRLGYSLQNIACCSCGLLCFYAHREGMYTLQGIFN